MERGEEGERKWEREERGRWVEKERGREREGKKEG